MTIIGLDTQEESNFVPVHFNLIFLKGFMFQQN